MGRLEARTADDLAGSGLDFSDILADFGGLPNSLGTLAHRPAVLRAILQLWHAIMLEGEVEAELKYLVGYMASRAAGCQYCSAHTAHNAHKHGASRIRIEAIWDYATSPLFSARERASLDFALAGGATPNLVEDAHFAALREHFDDAAIAELLAVISIYGFFNRWNDSLATPLELGPLAFGEAVLAPQGWRSGRHVPAASAPDQASS